MKLVHRSAIVVIGLLLVACTAAKQDDESPTPTPPSPASQDEIDPNGRSSSSSSSSSGGTTDPGENCWTEWRCIEPKCDDCTYWCGFVKICIV